MYELAYAISDEQAFHWRPLPQGSKAENLLRRSLYIFGSLGHMNSDWRSMSSGPTGSPAPHSQPLSRFTAGQTNVANYSDLRWSKRRSSDGGAPDDAPSISKDDQEEARSPWRTTVGNSAESRETADRLSVSTRPRLSSSASPRALALALPSRSDNSSSSPSRSPVHSDYSPLRQSHSLRSSPRSGFLRLHPVSANYGRIEDGAYSRSDMDLGSAELEGSREHSQMVYSSSQKSSPQLIPSRNRKTSFTSLPSTSGSPAQRDMSWRPRSNNSGNSLAPSPSLGSSRLAANSVYKPDNEVLKRRSTVGGISVDESARKLKETRKQSFTGEREQYGLGLERMFPLAGSRRTESQRRQTGGVSSQLAQLETVRSTSMSPSKTQSSASGSLLNRPTQKLVSGSYKSPPLALLSLNNTSPISGYDNEGSSPAPPKYDHFQPSSSLLEITQALRSKVDGKGSANGGAKRRSTAKLSPPQNSVPRSVQLNSRRQSITSLLRPPRSPSAMYANSRPEPNNSRGSLTHNRSYADLRQTTRRSTDTSIMGGALGLSVGQDRLCDEVWDGQCDEVVASENQIHRREHGDLPEIQHQQASYLPRKRTLSTRSTNDVLPETRRSADQKLVPMQSRNGRPTERTRPLSLRLSRSETSNILQREPPIGPPGPSSKPLSVLFPPFAEAPRVQSGLDTVTTEANSFSLPSAKRTASPTFTTGGESPRSRSRLGLPPDVVESSRSLPSSSFDPARPNGENGEVLVLREGEEVQTRLGTETEAAGKQSEEADNRHGQKQLEGEWFASDVDARAMMVGSRKHSYEEMLKQLLAGLRSIDLSEDLYDETTHRRACGGYSDIYQARSRRHNGMLVAVKRLRFKITEENAWKVSKRTHNILRLKLTDLCVANISPSTESSTSGPVSTIRIFTLFLAMPCTESIPHLFPNGCRRAQHEITSKEIRKFQQGTW